MSQEPRRSAVYQWVQEMLVYPPVNNFYSDIETQNPCGMMLGELSPIRSGRFTSLLETYPVDSPPLKYTSTSGYRTYKPETKPKETVELTPIEKPFSEYTADELFNHNRSRMTTQSSTAQKWFVYHVPYLFRPRSGHPLHGLWDKAYLAPVHAYGSVFTYITTRHAEDTIPNYLQCLYGGYREEQYSYSDCAYNISFLLTEEEAVNHAGYCPEKRSQFFGTHGQGLTYEEALAYTREYNNNYLNVSTLSQVLFGDANVSMSFQLQSLLSRVYQPRVNSGEQDSIQYYASVRDMLNRRLSTIRVGRFVRKVRPDLEDSKVEEMVRNWNSYFVNPDYELVVGDTVDHFVDAYTLTRMRDRNPDLPCNFKNLAYSCMHYGMGHWEYEHPASAYASGEFEVAMAVTKDKKIGGRVVIHKPTKTAGPTYVMDNFAIDMLQGYMKDQGIDTDPHRYAWDGAKLYVTPKSQNKKFMVLPYLDYGGIVYRSGDQAWLNEKNGATLAYGTSSTRGRCHPKEPCVVCGEFDGEDEDSELEYDVINGSGMTCYSCGQHVETVDGSVVPEEETIYYRGRYYSEGSEEIGLCDESGLYFLLDEKEYVNLTCGGYVLTNYLEAYVRNNGWDSVEESDWPDWKIDEENEDDDEEQEDVA